MGGEGCAFTSQALSKKSEYQIILGEQSLYKPSIYINFSQLKPSICHKERKRGRRGISSLLSFDHQITENIMSRLTY